MYLIPYTMDAQDEKKRIEDMKYLLGEISNRDDVLKELKGSEKGFFFRFFKFFKLKTKPNETMCSNGFLVHLDIDSKLRSDVIVAFEKSRDRLIKVYEEHYVK